MSVSRVAKTAGVSVATVSRVMNKSPAVTNETAAAVREAIAKLNYIPKPRARRSVPKRSLAIGFITVGYSGQSWRDVPVLLAAMGGASETAAAHDASLQIEALGEDVSPSRLLAAGGLDGALVIMSSTSRPGQVLDRAGGMPLVRAMGSADAPIVFDHVTFSSSAVGRQACQYLVETCGCRSLAFVTDQPARGYTRARAAAFTDAAANRGTAVHHYLNAPHEIYHRLFPGQCTELAGDRLIDALLDGRDGPLGVFVPTDYEAIPFCRMLEKRGITADRIRVVSCDNESARITALDHPPASIDLRAFEIGRLALRQLIYRIGNPAEPPLAIEVQPTLVLPRV